MKRILFVFLVFLTFFTVKAYAGDMKLEASLEKSRVSLGNPVYLYITFYGAKNADAPRVPAVDGLQIRYVGPSTKVSIVNGRISQSVRHAYLVLPRKNGDFKLGPFSVNYRGRSYTSDIVELTVTDKPSQASGASSYGGAGAVQGDATKPYAGDKMFLTIRVPKRSVYVNEMIPVTIELYIHDVDVKDISYPAYLHDGFSAGEYEEPERRRESIRGKLYNVLVLRQNLFGIKEGEYVVGPATVKCNVVTRSQPSRASSFFGIDDFFSSRMGYKTYPVEIQSDKIPVTIMPFPEKGRPTEFKGAVGNFGLEVYPDTDRIKVGDPVTVKMIIRGEGNLDTVTVPSFSNTEGFKTYEPQVSKQGTRKIYEQILIPKSEEIKEIPKVMFSFFNPSTRKYETLSKGPFPLTVKGRPEGESSVKMVSMPGEFETLYPVEELGRDIIHIKESIGKLRPMNKFLFREWLLWCVLLIPSVVVFLLYSMYARKERVLKDRKYARKVRAPSKARKGLAKAKSYMSKKESGPFFDTIFRTLQEYLGDKFNFPKGNVSFDIVSDELMNAGCDESVIKMLKDVVSRCEMARYASVSEDNDLADLLEKTKTIITSVEKLRK